MSESFSQWLVTSVQGLGLTDCPSVTQWLQDLRLVTEAECQCVLQGKSLSRDSTDIVFTASRSTKDTIDAVKGRAQVISAEFSKLFRKLEKERWAQVRSGVHRVCTNIRSLLRECGSSVVTPGQQYMQMEQSVLNECSRLSQCCDKELAPNSAPNKDALLESVSTLAQGFSTLVDLALGRLVQTLIRTLEDGAQSPYSMKSTITHLAELGLEGEHMCHLIAKEGGVRTLLEICRIQELQFAHAQALRAVATVCCVTESIQELAKVGGVECLGDILGDASLPEDIRCEAAGVIAQVTSPCLEHFQHLSGFIENLDDLVRALTSLCAEASSHEVFLLGSAALANITFMDSLSCDYLAQYSTVRILVDGCRSNLGDSPFAKDQVATVLANMAAVTGYCSEIVDCKGVPILVKMLQLSLNCNETEQAASERVLQKAAIALTRLCRQGEIAREVIALGGLPRLVELCKNPKERNGSEAVLVACLAAIRKISSVAGDNAFEKSDMEQLIKPRLMDSFLYCSGLEESFV